MELVAKDIASSVCGVSACVLMGQPFETIKVANQSQSGGATMSRAALSVVQRGGVPALWAGWPATLSSSLLSTTAAFTVNSAMNRLAPPQVVHGSDESDVYGTLHGMALGSLSGM